METFCVIITLIVKITAMKLNAVVSLIHSECFMCWQGCMSYFSSFLHPEAGRIDQFSMSMGRCKKGLNCCMCKQLGPQGFCLVPTKPICFYEVVVSSCKRRCLRIFGQKLMDPNAVAAIIQGNTERESIISRYSYIVRCLNLVPS